MLPMKDTVLVIKNLEFGAWIWHPFFRVNIGTFLGTRVPKLGLFWDLFRAWFRLRPSHKIRTSSEAPNIYIPIARLTIY